LKRKEHAKEEAMHMKDTQLVSEIEMLCFVLLLVCRNNGRSKAS